MGELVISQKLTHLFSDHGKLIGLPSKERELAIIIDLHTPTVFGLDARGRYSKIVTATGRVGWALDSWLDEVP